MNWRISKWLCDRILKGKAKKLVRHDGELSWASFNGLAITATGKVSLMWDGHEVAYIEPCEWHPERGDTLYIESPDSMRGEINFRIIP